MDRYAPTLRAGLARCIRGSDVGCGRKQSWLLDHMDDSREATWNHGVPKQSVSERGQIIHLLIPPGLSFIGRVVFHGVLTVLHF